MRPRAALILLLFAIAAAGHMSATMAAGATPTATTSGTRPAPQVYPTVGKVTAAPGASYALSFKGTAVNFDLSGLEPDFDPIYKLTVTGTLHDKRAASRALPDATLILSAYLEAFKPDTTPILPDLLHPDQVATGLGGFLSGKAALVNAGGHVVYRGSLLAEIFQDNTEHLIVDLDPLAGGPSVRLQGIVTLKRGGDEEGTLRALSPLARGALAVPQEPAIAWQDVVNGLNVHKPPMMGTAGSSASQAPAKPSTIAPLAPAAKPNTACDLACRVRRPATLASLGLGAAIVLLGIIVSVRRRRPWRAPP